MDWHPTSEPWLTLWAALAFCAAAFVAPRFVQRFLSGLLRVLRSVARRKIVAIAILFLLAIAVRLGILPLLPVPNPGIHDEFSYLLMADTFVHERLTNPPHPMWRSFETFHVLSHPTYASKYPPAQGAVLAFGQLLGHPWIGVLLSTAAMCAAFFWALCPFMPARWALMAALLAFLRLGIASYWMNSYWGGSVAAIGGAMVLGAVGRILQRRATPGNSVLLGLGLAILANSRPFEGLVFCAPLLTALLLWFFRHKPNQIPLRIRLVRVALPLLAIGSATLIFMGYYNWRVTGNPLLMPHVLAGRQYDRSALFIWQRARPAIEFGNVQLDQFYDGWERENYDRTWSDFLLITQAKWQLCRKEFLWPGLILALPGLLFVRRDRRFRLPLASLLSTLLAFALLAWWCPHYIAPTACVVFGVLAQVLRHTCQIRVFRKPIGAALVLACTLTLIVDVAAAVDHRVSDPVGWGGWGLLARADLERKLEQTSGRHLVIVRYDPDHSVHEEWVYNGADIDSQKVIWARELDSEQNSKLLACYNDRRVWLIQPDQDDSNLEPYGAPPSPSSGP